jgi:glycosyltransferase involved in cell wall biosynthesis
MKTAVLIPCYNEAKTIRKVVSDFKRVMPHAEIYVYDNNSTDGTDKIAEDAGAIVRYEYKQGKGNVVRTMFRQINADCYIMVDGDDTYPAEAACEIERIILENRADMVIGDRLSSTYFEENNRPFHNTGNRVVRKFINIFFKSDLKDIMTGMRGFNYDFAKSFPIQSKGFEIETEMSVFALINNFKIHEIPID